MNKPVLPRRARVAGRVVAAALGGLLLIGVVMMAWVGIRGSLAYTHLRDAQTAASGLRSDLGKPATASAAIAALRTDTSAARSLTSDPIWRLAEVTPWIGPQLAASLTLTS